MNRTFALSTALLVALACAACGSEDPDPVTPADGGKPAGPLLPFAEGNRWTYRVTENGAVSEKTTTVEAEDPVGGTGPHAGETAHRVVTRKGQDLKDQTVGWQAQLGDRVVRYREQSYGATTGDLELEERWDPPKLHVDGSAAHVAEGAQWLEVYDETKIPTGGTESTSEARDLWSVVAISEEITVPAGTFDALVLRKVGGSTKTYWYVRGVGKVKEVGGQTEELTEYEVR